MSQSRRGFLKEGAVVLGAAAVTGTLVSCKPGPAETENKGEGKEKIIVAACGLSCTACPLMKAKKCKGCAPGDKASAEMMAMKKCPVLSCANMKKIAYCGRDCKGFTKCPKMIGCPYDESFMKKIADRLAS